MSSKAGLPNSAAFQAQADAGEVACPVCGDTHVAKALMAPNVATRSSAAKGSELAAPKPQTQTLTLAQQKEQAAQVLAMMRAVKEHVEQNFDNVGPKFAEEARKIHYGETDKRNIYGQATRDEAEELVDEGIEIGQIPTCPTSTDSHEARLPDRAIGAFAPHNIRLPIGRRPLLARRHASR